MYVLTQKTHQVVEQSMLVKLGQQRFVDVFVDCIFIFKIKGLAYLEGRPKFVQLSAFFEK